jgi:cytochrome c peroxidase
MKHNLTTIIFLLFVIIIGCQKNKDNDPIPVNPSSATPFNLTIPKGFPTILNIPADNPMTVEGIELGRYLFYDGRLSGRTDTLMSCASCHKQKHAFVVGMDKSQYSSGGHPYGVTGIPTPHAVLPMINLVFNSTGYLWNGLIYPDNPTKEYRNIEDIVGLVIILPNEIHGDTNKTKAMIQSIAMYPPMFKKAFGSDIVTMKNISRAIAQFVRTLVSSNSRFDKYLRGEQNLSGSEMNGFSLFVTESGADCFHCHGSEGNPLFTTNLTYNNGKDTCFTEACGNIGDRYSVTGNPSDIGAFVAPTLRNIELTAPYMHDGRFTSLDEVINFYNSGLKWSLSISPLMHHISTGGIQLTYANRQNLKAFLLSLSDNDFVSNPEFSNPRPDDPYFIKE